MGNLATYWHIVTISAREDRANPMRLVGSLLVGAIRIVILAAIYKAAYEVVGGAELPYANALWSIALYFAIVIGLGMRQVFRLVDREVKSGAVEVGLIKPLDWRMTKACTQFGRNILEAALTAAIFAAVLLIIVGPPDMSFVTPGFLVGYLVLLILAVVASSALFMTVGLTAFWLNDSQSTFRIIDKVIMIFGGAYVPIALLPDMVQEIIRFSPFGMYAASTQLFNPGLVEHLVPTLISSAIWTILTVMFCNWVWRKVEKRVEVNGG